MGTVSSGLDENVLKLIVLVGTQTVVRTSERCELCCIRRMVQDNVKTLISNSPFSTPLLLCTGNGLSSDFHRKRSGSITKPVSACSELKFPRKT